MAVSVQGTQAVGANVAVTSKGISEAAASALMAVSDTFNASPDNALDLPPFALTDLTAAVSQMAADQHASHSPSTHAPHHASPGIQNPSGRGR